MAVEGAVVYGAVMVLLLALVLGGVGVFRYEQVACQAREAARWASVRGGNWQQATNKASPTQDEILQQAVLPLAAGMEPAKISIRVQWIDQSSGTAVDWDSAPKDVRSAAAGGGYVTNTVRVTVSYAYAPQFFITGSVTVTSTSEIPMSF